ncbi:TonB-dependent receptor [Bisgaard Taxon 45]
MTVTSGKVSPFFAVLMASCLSRALLAHAENKQVVFLDEISVESQGVALSGDPLSGLPKQNDILVSKQKLKTGSSTLGNALAGELSVHSNQFGGGASAPIIRGQETVRLKVLQNGSDVIDMSQLSPDHAIGVDTLLADRVEVVRGASTLLYATASQAGVINVVDKRIPTRLPNKGYEVDLGWRYNLNNAEKLTTLGLSVGLGQHIALRFEGLGRDAKDYHVPYFKSNQVLKYAPDTYNKTQATSYGLSFIGERGYVGFAYNQRAEKYGIPGHNHFHDSCGPHIWGGNVRNDYYLNLYPHLMGDTDLVTPHDFHCGNDHSHSAGFSHEQPYGVPHEHSVAGPYVRLRSTRYDIRAELNNPVSYIDKFRLSYSNTDYFHDERDGDIPVNLFVAKGDNVRFEFLHQPMAGLSGIWGVQYQKQQSSANLPRIAHCTNRYEVVPFGEKPKFKPRCTQKLTAEKRHAAWVLPPHQFKQMGVFAVEQWRWKTVLVEAGVRTEKQKIAIDYDIGAIEQAKARASGKRCLFSPCDGKAVIRVNTPDLSARVERATSYSLSTTWSMTPDYALMLGYSHNERSPTPMELYLHGRNLATNSFKYGNKDLKKEVSNNIELGLSYIGEKLSYQVSVYYYRFKNRIFSQILRREGNLTQTRYTQSQAKYYGAEGRLDYQLTPATKLGIFGDYVRGKLFDLPPTYQRDALFTTHIPIAQPDQDAPRVPPARLGFRVSSELTEKLSTTLDYTYVYKQHKVAPLEHQTAAYSMLNMGLEYRDTFAGIGYQLFLQGNNLLNRRVYSHTSFQPFVPQPGRAVMFGLNLRF